jgi:hypothetical protein
MYLVNTTHSTAEIATNSMEQSPSSEANGRPAKQELL